MPHTADNWHLIPQCPLACSTRHQGRSKAARTNSILTFQYSRRKLRMTPTTGSHSAPHAGETLPQPQSSALPVPRSASTHASHAAVDIPGASSHRSGGGVFDGSPSWGASSSWLGTSEHYGASPLIGTPFPYLVRNHSRSQGNRLHTQVRSHTGNAWPAQPQLPSGGAVLTGWGAVLRELGRQLYSTQTSTSSTQVPGAGRTLDRRTGHPHAALQRRLLVEV